MYFWFSLQRGQLKVHEWMKNFLIYYAECVFIVRKHPDRSCGWNLMRESLCCLVFGSLAFQCKQGDLQQKHPWNRSLPYSGIFILVIALYEYQKLESCYCIFKLLTHYHFSQTNCYISMFCSRRHFFCSFSGDYMIIQKVQRYMSYGNELSSLWDSQSSTVELWNGRDIP